jgi:GMP synthase (glutamine-hydrolysing)
MKIGILQAGHVPDEMLREFGNYSDMFERFLGGQGFTFQTWDVVNMDFPTSSHLAEGWLITGSKHGVYENHPWIAPLEQLVRDIYAAKQPLVGVCFGHQLIAQALGGKVEKFKNGWAVGHQSYEMDGDDMPANAWHQDQVTDLPSDARVVASNDFCENAALLYGDQAFTVQWHPEFEAEFVDGLLKHRAPGVVPGPLIKDAESKLKEPVSNVVLAQQIGGFFRKPRSK